MPRLVQLSLDRKGGGQYPPKEASLWPGVTRGKDIAYRYALLIHSVCPTLQYIQIYDWAWQVMVSPTALPPQVSKSVVDLRLLEFEEVMAIEIFAIGRLSGQCGLLGLEEPAEPRRESIFDDWDQDNL